ncbi:MAG: hypothetical protein WAW42_15205 [Candidatus Competibacteraceae bacterium]
MHPQRAFLTSPRSQRHVAAVQVNVVGTRLPACTEHDAPVALGGLVAHLVQGGQEQPFQHLAGAILHHGAMVGKAHGHRPGHHRLSSRPVEQHPQRVIVLLDLEMLPRQHGRDSRQGQRQGDDTRPAQGTQWQPLSLPQLLRCARHDGPPVTSPGSLASMPSLARPAGQLRSKALQRRF